jgi:hypothetical protein
MMFVYGTREVFTVMACYELEISGVFDRDIASGVCRQQSVIQWARLWIQHTTKCAPAKQGMQKPYNLNMTPRRSLTNNCSMFSGRNTILLRLIAK